MHRALVVDDDPLMREIVGEHLRETGLTVEFAADGMEALQAVGEWQFRLIVTDMFMPNMDGLELIRALRERASHTPIIGMSAGVSGLDADIPLRAAIAAGAQQVLRKPISQTALLAAVHAVLSRRDQD
ncbi:MAG: response regulator [Hyphomonadaceae bacterium]|nr:response regulator [Hyphomonadaceae bacterium]